jgi:hypothetical protein
MEHSDSVVFYDVNLLGDNMDTIEKNTETLINTSKEDGLEINVEKTKYMLLSRHQNRSRNRDREIVNTSFENVPQFKYFRTSVTNQNVIQKEIRGDCVRSMLATIQYRTFCLPACCQKNLKIRTQTIILTVVFVWVRNLVPDTKGGAWAEGV